MEQQPIRVVLAADHNYVMPLTVAICSAASHCDRSCVLAFHVIEHGIGRELRARVESSLQATGFPNAGIEWIEAPVDRFRDLRVVHRYMSPLIYARLLIPELLPDTIDKALYLDSDVIVNDDLRELWDLPLGGRSLLAAVDRIGFIGAVGGVAHYRELGLDPDAKYFNTGVLVMNLRKWREGGTTARVLDYLRTNRDHLRMEDQEALNVVLFGDWGELDFRWNWQIPWRGVRRGTHSMNWVPPTTRKSIVHFTTAEKPWLPGCDYEEKRCFFEHLNRTAWAGWRVPLVREATFRAVRAMQDARDTIGAARRAIVQRRRHEPLVR